MHGALPLNSRDRVLRSRLAGGKSGPPATSTLKGRRLFGHCVLSGSDLRLDRIEVEACTTLHRRELDRGHRQLLHLLLDEHEAPELELEPVEVLLGSELSP